MIRHHHGDATFDVEYVNMFHGELDPKVTLPMALEAVRSFYAAQSDKWMQAADINAYAKRMRDRNRPSEAAICDAMQRAGITGVREEQAYRRAVNQMVAEGKNAQDALQAAFSMQPDKFITANRNGRIQPRQNVLTRQPTRLRDILGEEKPTD
ncbi:hypothetical protein BCUN_0616 [Bifidobacterium cuniculi]|uniref:Uncharacterized protein n=2 Tax=Bifidobacterium cuniculi TaxID=1688 RepID=A0A087B512_9BIFI|nr:hypothetical protein BCUN_0616 [Bifidobacterium cuniculi]